MPVITTSDIAAASQHSSTHVGLLSPVLGLSLRICWWTLYRL